MPRERIHFFRLNNSKPKEKLFVVAFEGNDTERIYFEEFRSYSRFNSELIHLHPLKRSKNDTNSAPKHVFNKLKKEVKDEYSLSANDELWMVIDRDRWKKIDEIYNLCRAEGNIFMALSNPCFELWILLHYKDLNKYSDEEKNEMFYNKKVTTKRTYLKKLLSDIIEGGYNESNLNTKELFENIDYAVSRARELDNNREELPSGLGSHVYKLIEKLIIPL